MTLPRISPERPARPDVWRSSAIQSDGHVRENGFLSNHYRTRTDVERGLIALLDPLEAHTSPGGALITLGSTGTHYDLRACQLEAFSRPLWGLVSLIAGGGASRAPAIVERWSKGLASGTDPESDEFWGFTKGKDQRMVEMSAIGFALAFAGDEILKHIDDSARKNIGDWLGAINNKPMPDTNWLWFRVFANLGLKAINHPTYNEERFHADIDHLDSFQLRGDESGWSRDGPEGVMQLDYYSGSFAIMFAQLAYSKLAAKDDPERCENYRRRAQRFLLDQMYYFDNEGRAIPFGRSMIYRFAVISTFSAMALADCPPPAPLTWGHIKGMVLRHLRYWSTCPDIFNSDSTLNIGYVYSNMNMTENYNGFGSPYWCTKAFACLAVDDTHPFWASEELPWPTDLLPPLSALPDPHHIMVRPLPGSVSAHTYLLSSGQSCHYALKHGAEKYGKFAYSSSFGFSCPTGMFGLEQLAADSMLALCDDPPEAGYGEGERWRVRRDPIDAQLREAEGSPYLQSKWQPWPDVSVETWLLPPQEPSSCWYLRVHRITSGRHLRTAEGGWAMHGQGDDGRAIVQVFSGETSAGGLEADGEARAKTSAGAIGLATIDLPFGEQLVTRGKLVQSDPNSNVIFPRTVLPTLLGDIKAGSTVWTATAVFAVAAQDGKVPAQWETEWNKRPVFPSWLATL